MGQKNELEMTLAAIRRKKQVYIKNLELVHTIEQRENLRDSISVLSEEEQKILNQLKYDEII